MFQVLGPSPCARQAHIRYQCWIGKSSEGPRESASELVLEFFCLESPDLTRKKMVGQKARKIMGRVELTHF